MPRTHSPSAFLRRLFKAIAEDRVRITLKADGEIATLGWSHSDAFDELAALVETDLLRTEPAKHPEFRWIWVFCPLVAELDRYLWIRLAERDDDTILVSFHLAEEDPWT